MHTTGVPEWGCLRAAMVTFMVGDFSGSSCLIIFQASCTLAHEALYVGVLRLQDTYSNRLCTDVRARLHVTSIQA
jgi:hypothetical protein